MYLGDWGITRASRREQARWTHADRPSGRPEHRTARKRMRNGAPFVLANLKAGDGLPDIAAFVTTEGLLEA